MTTPDKYSATNPGPGMKFDSGKPRWGLIPTNVLRVLACVLTFGALKYEANNWQNVADGEERYFDALMRHLDAWRSGERYDQDSGLPHLACALCNLVFLTWLFLRTNAEDSEDGPELRARALEKWRASKEAAQKIPFVEQIRARAAEKKR